MSTDRVATLKRITYFSGLTDEELARLAPRCRWKSVNSGELIIGQKDQSYDVIFLLTGMARVNVYSLSGRQVSFRDIRPGDIVGELSAIDGAPRSASVESLQPSTFLVIPQAVFHDIIQSHPSVLFAVLRHLTKQIRVLTSRVFEFSTLAVRSRVQAELIRLAKEQGGGSAPVILPAPTHSEIANRISTHREAVTRELSRLHELGIISRQGRALRINDFARLQEMVESLSAE